MDYMLVVGKLQFVMIFFSLHTIYAIEANPNILQQALITVGNYAIKANPNMYQSDVDIECGEPCY